MASFSSVNREEIRTKFEESKFDLLVIGGGITGAGIALDAVSRGLNVGLVEMQDYAAGTSSRSTKLIHGGLRYLKQFEVKLVAKVGKERAIVYENGPHVTTPEWMLLPFYRGGTFGPFTTNIGLTIYDYLAGVKKAERKKMLSPEEALKKEPLLRKDHLRGAGFYVEYKTDDARLTIEVMKKAVELRCVALNYTKVTELTYDDTGKVNGAIVKDLPSNKTYTIEAKKVVNATGPWVDTLREKDGSKDNKTLYLTKGVHLVFSQEHFPLKQAIYFDTFDKRMVFAIPRDGKTYVGTTDTHYTGELENPPVTKEDRKYLLRVTNEMFPALKLTEEDIESCWAGLRPLIAESGKKPGEISRKDEIFVSNSGLYSIAGGKLTGYRKMAEEVVDKIVAELNESEKKQYGSSKTISLPISGGDVGGSAGFREFKKQKMKESLKIGFEEDTANRIVQMFGSNVDKLFEIYAQKKKEKRFKNIDPLVSSLVYYAVQYEQAYKPMDFFFRRTGTLLFDIDWVHAHKDSVIQIMRELLDWSHEETAEYGKELDTYIQSI